MYPPATWRLIIQPPADGATNMAIDEAIVEQVRAGQAPPTLRFYAWEPACLSLGYAQPVAEVDFGRLYARGWQAVRRLTGGRAILHTDEVTYSVAVPEDDPRVAGGVIESYRRLSEGLLAGLRLLGADVRADRKAGEMAVVKGPVCFEVPSDYEITFQGRKLLGSAQTRRGEVVLQHGALPLYGDLSRICDALVFEDEAAREKARMRVLRRAITLEEALGRPVWPEEVVAALADGFAHALNLRLEESPMTEREWNIAKHLRAEKYATEDWIQRH
jgi:lipoate-protein ligase A